MAKITKLSIITLILTLSWKCSDSGGSSILDDLLNPDDNGNTYVKEICDNGIDDDGNTFTDCDDPICAGLTACKVEICDNNYDDNQNSLTDCDDPDCAGDAACPGTANEKCTNSKDDDGDNLTDCDDPDCYSHTACLEEDVLIECGVPNEPSTGVCEVTSGAGTSVILKGTVLTSTTTYVDGEVLYDESTEKITCVGCECSSAAGYSDATLLNCGSNIISPSLINAHDHIGWLQAPPVGGANHPDGHGDIRYTHRNEWRRGINGFTKVTVPGGITAAERQWGELRQVMAGVTSMFGSGSSSGLMRNVDQSGDPLAFSNPPEYETFPLYSSSTNDINIVTVTSGCVPPYDFGGVTSTSGFSAYVPHVSEGTSTSSRNEFLCMSGSEPDGYDLLNDNTAYIHAVGLNATDAMLMAAEGSGVVWSARTNIDLYGHTAPVTLLHRLGVKIGLGTDWMPSGSMNMLRELQCADNMNKNYYNNYFSSKSLWRMATVDGAEVLALNSYVGDLKANLYADIAVFDRNGETNPHQAVIDARVPEVALVLRGGKPLSGDQTIVSALASGCDTLDACGVSKQVCLSSEIGSNYSTLLTNVGTVGTAYDDTYPLFYCTATPLYEPSCKPARTVTGEYTGDITGDDSDGDGIVNASDNCPNIFNPIRPLDGGSQSDIDNDDVGDECDVCPLNADTTSCTWDPDDLDSDGEPNATDNCPSDPNPGQEDADDDNIGDDCDPCPNTDQTGATGGSIRALRKVCNPDHPPEGTVVTVEGIITAVDNNKFWIQDPALTKWAGLYIFTSSLPTVTTGDIGKEVTVTGTYVEFNSATQIEDPTNVSFINETPAPIAPAPFAVGDINNDGVDAEEMEGMLVSIASVSVSDANPDLPDDYGEMEVEDMFNDVIRIDDDIYNGFVRTFGTPYSSIIGIATYSHSNRKILPRDASDMAP